MTKADEKNTDNFLIDTDNLSKQMIYENEINEEKEIYEIAPADFTSFSPERENQNAESKLRRIFVYLLRHQIVIFVFRIVSSIAFLAYLSYLAIYKSHLASLRISEYGPGTSPIAAISLLLSRPKYRTGPATMANTFTLDKSSPPLSPLEVSHPVRGNLNSSALEVDRSKKFLALQKRCIIILQNPFFQRRNAVGVRQPSFQGSRRNLLETKRQPSVVDRSSIILENDFAFTSFKWKTRRLVVKGRKRRPVIRCTGFKNLQHRRNPSLSSYLNRTKRMPLRKSLLYRPRSRSVLACSSNNDEKKSSTNDESVHFFHPYTEPVISLVNSQGKPFVTNLLPTLIYLKLILETSQSVPLVITLLPRLIAFTVFLENKVIPFMKTYGPVLESGAKVIESGVNTGKGLIEAKKGLIEAKNELDKSTIKGKQKMQDMFEYNQDKQEILNQIKDNSDLRYWIKKALIKDIKNVEDVARPELATNRTVVRFNVLPKVWDSKKTQMIIAAYKKGKSHHLFNRIAATRYLSLWNNWDFPIHAASCRFKQRMLERAASFTGEIADDLRLIMDSEDLKESSPDSLDKKIHFLKLHLFSHALPSLGAQISTKEESFPSESDAFWKNHEQELINISFYEARKRYEEETESKVPENDLQECIKGFLDADLL